VSGAAALRAKHAGRKIIVGVDNAQYLSGIGLKLNAYERLLADSAVWRDKLVLVQRCLVPGARRLDEYRTLREIRAIVKRIQKRFGESAIDYEEVYGSSMPVDQRLALWKASDCLLNSELRGGFHPWPLEFIYAQKGVPAPESSLRRNIRRCLEFSTERCGSVRSIWISRFPPSTGP